MEESSQTAASNPEDVCICNSERCKELFLSQELDTILSLSNPRVDKIWPLLTNKQLDMASYLELLAEYKPQRHCGVTWSPGYVAYRCRSCSDVLAMAVCSDCFRDGNHEGHDYNMFKSRSGGACDCGYNLMKESGHCKRHGNNVAAKRPHEQIPANLICVPKRAMPRLVHRLAIGLRQNQPDAHAEHVIFESYLNCLRHIANSSAILRNLMVEVLLSEKDYVEQLHLLSKHPDEEFAQIISKGLRNIRTAGKNLLCFKIPDGWKDSNQPEIKAFCDTLKPTCFLEELVLWAVVYAFPTKLVSILLSFLMDKEYKLRFAKAFVRYYPRILVLMAGDATISSDHRNSHSYELLTRRLIHVSVQLYNNASLTNQLCEEEYTLHTLIYCIKVAIEGSQGGQLKGALKPNSLCSNRITAPKVVCYDSIIFKESRLGSFHQDLNAILDYEEQAGRIVDDRHLLYCWLNLVSYFQTMNPYKRALHEHNPYDSPPQHSLFTIESDFCLSPMWSILSSLYSKQPTNLTRTRTLLQSIQAKICNWLHKMNIGPTSLLDPYQISFHIPLHRIFAATIRHMMFVLDRSDEEIYSVISCSQGIFGQEYAYKSASGTSKVITTECFFKMLLLHPLQVLTICNETKSNMWVRNGLTTAHQALTYIHCLFCYSTIDLDMFLMRYCASKLDPNYFVNIVMSRFHAWKWLSFKSNILMSNASDEVRRPYHFNILPEQIIQMVENSLLLLIQLLTLSIHCDISEKEQTRQEMVAIIAVKDRLYSYLCDALPDKNFLDPANLDEYFKTALEELTIYKPAQHGSGGALQQGCYTLKSNIWLEEYNPIQVLYRYSQKREYQQSLERFFQHCKRQGLLEKCHHSSSMWPPLRIPKNIGKFGQLSLRSLLECPTLAGVVFSIIYKNLYIGDVPDSIMAYAIHLLELSLRNSLREKEEEARRKDPMETSRHSSIESRQTNPMFTGKYCYSELTSCPAYFGSKGEAYIKGSTIFTSNKSMTGKNDVGAKEDGDERRLFPVVKDALDLAFETTWFPFKSIVDNCLVHIENVHAMPQQDFVVLLNNDGDIEDDIGVNNLINTTGETTSDASGTGGGSSSLIDDGLDDDEEVLFGVEDVEQQQRQDIDDDSEMMLDTSDFDSSTDGYDTRPDESSDENIDYDLMEHPSIVNLMRSLRDEGNSIAPSLIIQLVREAQAYELSRGSAAATTSQGAVDDAAAATSTSRQEVQVGSSGVAPSDGHSWISSLVARLPVPASAGGTSPAVVDGLTPEIRQRAIRMAILRIRSLFAVVADQDAADEAQARQIFLEAQNQQEQQMDVTPLITEETGFTVSQQDNSVQDDVEMVTVTFDADVNNGTANSPLITSTIAATTSSPLRTGNDGSIGGVSPNIDGSGGSGGSWGTMVARARAAAIRLADHTYSADGGVGGIGSGSESPRERQRQQTLESDYSLVPVVQPAQATEQTQLYPENLVTERRAILASDPRPMIAGSPQPLALEGSPGRGGAATITAAAVAESGNNSASGVSTTTSTAAAATMTTTRQATSASTTTSPSPSTSMVTDHQQEQSLSEVDIQARFMGFFQSGSESSQAAAARLSMAPRHYRQRQMARRGGFRGSIGPVSPYAVHNPTNAAVDPRIRPYIGPAPLAAPTANTAATSIAASQGVPASPSAIATTRLRLQREFAPDHMVSLFSQDEMAYLIDRYQNPEPRLQTARRTSGPPGLAGRRLPSLPPATNRTTTTQPPTASTSTPIQRPTTTTTTTTTTQQQQQRHQHQHHQQHQQHLEQKKQLQRGQQRSRRARKDKMHHGESILSLLLRLHAKYSHKARSYEFNGSATANRDALAGDRLGDGAHFVTIVLDLICRLDQAMVAKLAQLQALIWGDKPAENVDAAKATAATVAYAAGSTTSASGELASGAQVAKAGGGGGADGDDDMIGVMEIKTNSMEATQLLTRPTPPTPSVDPAERRRRAKEFQSKLMAQFASKQKAFIEKYELQQQHKSAAGTSSIAPSAASAAAAQSGADKMVSNCSMSSLAPSTLLGAKTAVALEDSEEPINLSSKLSHSVTEAKSAVSPMSSLTANCDKRQQQHQSASQPQLAGRSSSLMGARGGGSSCVQEEPMTTTNRASRQDGLECCICGCESLDDDDQAESGDTAGEKLANPLGLVVLLQSTSVLGHSTLRRPDERQLPCEDQDYLEMREETYAKYLERRIDLLAEHFCQSSWLDSINIGAEGGVHVQSCGHYLHVECHQSYIKSLDHDRPRFRNDSDEFLCPVCRQLANSVLPILGPHARSGLRNSPGGGNDKGQKLLESSPMPLVEVKTEAMDEDGGGEQLQDQIKLIGSLLARRLAPNRQELQSSALFCAHLTKATAPQYRLVRGAQANMHSLFLFLTSIARTNLELEVIAGSPSALQVNGGGGQTSASFVPLFRVLALNARTLINDRWFSYDQIWSYLTHCIDEKNRLGVSKPANSQVPLLLRDPQAMLLQFLFALPPTHLSKAHFTCLVQILFNLAVIQSTALVLSYVEEEAENERRCRRRKEDDFDYDDDDDDDKLPEDNHSDPPDQDQHQANEEDDGDKEMAESEHSHTSSSDFQQLVQLVKINLCPVLAPQNEVPLMNSSVRNGWRHLKPALSCRASRRCDHRHNHHEVSVKLTCLPFLRVAAHLGHHLCGYGSLGGGKSAKANITVFSFEAIETEFEELVGKLQLGLQSNFHIAEMTGAGQEQRMRSLASALRWPNCGQQELVVSWSRELLQFNLDYPIAARTLLLSRSPIWFRPSLMRLASNFDDIFMHYYRRKCSLCQQVPRDLVICLVCGAPLCFRVSCCRDKSRSAVLHSQQCGAQTAVFLAVHTSSIVVIRGQRACVWGSVYLDGHGEEDNGLQRGRPLYLVPDRYRLLERQWLTHTFDHKYSKPWIWLQDTQ